MPIVASDWSIDRSTGDIRYIGNDHGGGSPSYATVIEFHRWLQDLADDASSSGDDELDITDENPSSRSTDNIITLLGNYNIDDNAAEHLYDGSIIQGAVGVDQIIYDGIVNFGNSDVQIQIIQNGAVLADDWWNFSGAGLNPDAAAGISHRFMIKVHDFVGSGGDIDGRRLLGTCRRFGFTYSEFSINGSSRGNNVLALSDSNDLNNDTASGTVATWTTITNSTEGYVLLDVDNNSVDEAYYSEWNRDTYTINQFYERMKYLTRDGSAETLYGLNGELFRGITHEIDLSGTNSGTFNAFEPVSWTGGTGQMLAIDNQTASSATKMWIQLLTGVPPTNTQLITGGTSTATATASGSATSRSISTPFVGQSTGSALIGSYGLSLETTDLTAADIVTDLTDTAVFPPNLVTYIVGGVVNAEDQIAVYPWDGTTTDNEGNPAVDAGQMTLTSTLNTDNVTSIAVSNGTETAIPSDTPASGWLRVQDDNGFYRNLEYSSWTGTTFTISTTNGQEDFAGVNATAGNNVFIGYIDVLYDGTTATDRFTCVYSADRDLLVKVRDGKATPIKEFITSSVLGSNGGGVTAIRTTDE